MWDFGDGSTSSATNPGTYAWGAAGDYTVTLYAINGPCVDSITLDYTILPNSIDEWFGRMDVKFYPNPTEGTVWLELANHQEFDLAMDVRGVDGKLYHTQSITGSQRQIEIDLSNYSAGMYFISLRAGGHQLVQRVIKL